MIIFKEKDMASEDKTYCGREDRSHVDEGDDTKLAMLSRKLGVTVKDLVDIMTQRHIGINQLEDYFHNNQNAY